MPTVTTLLVARFRIELIVPGSRRTITQVAEDAQFLSYTASGDDMAWPDPAATADLDPDAAQAARVAVASFMIERYGANMVGDLAAAFRDAADAAPTAIVTCGGN